MGDEAFERGFTIDEGCDDFAVTRFAFFEDDGVAIADVGVDHGFSADAEGEGFMFATTAERMDIDGEATFGFGSGAIAKASSDTAVDGDVADFFTVEFLRKDHGTGFAGNALDDAFFSSARRWLIAAVWLAKPK